MTETLCKRCAGVIRSTVASGLCPRCLFTALVDGTPGRDMPADPEPEARRVGPYELLEEIARGAMGIVFRARERSLGRVVALKLLKGGTWASPDLFERFRTEATAAASLLHPNIVPVYGFGDEGEDCYIAMRLIEGGSLADWRRHQGKGSSRDLRDAVSVDRRAAVIIRKIADAVHHAHQRGVLHRDVKPGNVLLDREGEPFLTDFGLARLVNTDVRITGSHTSLGTPAYLAPEVARRGSGEATVLSDVYGLGAVLYELLAGRPPFEAGTPLELMRLATDTEAPRPSSLRPWLHPDLETICLKCLSKEPGLRYASAIALAGDLERWLGGRPIEARPAGSLERAVRWARRRPLIAGLLALLLLSFLLITIGSWRFSQAQRIAGEQKRESLVRFNVNKANQLLENQDLAGSLPYQIETIRLEAGQPEREAVHRIRLGLTLQALPEVIHVWRHDRAATTAEFSRDGKRVVSASIDQTVRIWDVATGEPGRILRHSSGVRSARFNPDGRKVLSVCGDGTAHCWDSELGVEMFPGWRINVSYYQMPLIPDASFSPDGSLIVSAHGGTVEIRNASSGELAFPRLGLNGPVACASISPEGSRLLTAVEEGMVEVWKLDAAGLRRQSSHRHRKGASFASFSARGDKVVSVGMDAEVSIWESATGDLVASPASHDSRLRIGQATFNPVDDRVVSFSFDGSVRLWDGVSDSILTRGIESPRGVTVARWAPAGDRLLLGGFDGMARIWDARTGMLVDSWLRHGRYVVDGGFSPATNQVVTACQDGSIRLWGLKGRSPRGSEGRARPDPQVGLIVNQAGTQVARWDDDGILTLSPTSSQGGAVRSLKHPHPVTAASFDPTGKSIATTTSDRRLHLWSLADGTEPVPAAALVGDPQIVVFSGDGRRVGVVCRLPGSTPGSALVVHDAATLARRVRLQREPGGISFAELSPDGQWAATGHYSGRARIWDASTGEESKPPLDLEPELVAARFTPDGLSILTHSAGAGFEPQSAMLWSLKTHKPVGLPLRHDDGVNAVAFSTDGGRVATGGEDGVARVWSLPQCNPLTPPMRHGSKVVSLVFGLGGRILATATSAGDVRLWDAGTGEPLMPVQRTEGGVAAMIFVDGGPDFLVLGPGGVSRRWDCSPALLSTQDMERITTRLNGRP